MKIVILAAAFVAFALPAAGFARGHSGYHAPRYSSGSTVHVRSYTTRSGHYVQPHYRTAPDHTATNNWSSRPNINPYTGAAGTKDPNNPGH